MRDGPLLKPRAVRPGDRVAVVAPASPFPVEAFEAGVAELRRLGFEPVFEPGRVRAARVRRGRRRPRAPAR